MPHRPRPHPRVTALITKAFAHGFKITEVLTRAGVAGSTWTRWAAGHEPIDATVQKVDKALDELIAEDEQPPA